MNDYSGILRYMGHNGNADAQLEALIASSWEKLDAVSAPLHAIAQFVCTISGNHITINGVNIESAALAIHLSCCTQVYIFAATLGADVDRLITQRTKIDSAEALCLQACAAVKIENYCNRIEQELSQDTGKQGLYLRPRFSPGYGDFNIAHQTDILRLLQAHKRIGVSETKNNMLSPLKSVTAIIGVSPNIVPDKVQIVPNSDPNLVPDKCADCRKTDCPYKRKVL